MTEILVLDCKDPEFKDLYKRFENKTFPQCATYDYDLNTVAIHGLRVIYGDTKIAIIVDKDLKRFTDDCNSYYFANRFTVNGKFGCLTSDVVGIGDVAIDTFDALLQVVMLFQGE